MSFPQAEMEGRYAATLLLSSQKKEAAAAAKRLQEQYEARLREKQMDLNAALRKVQVFDACLPSVYCVAIKRAHSCWFLDHIHAG